MSNTAIQALDICIDVSHWQGTINWPAVRASGILIAFIKATEGADYIDPMFSANQSIAEAAGLIVIPYHFLRPGDANEQVSHFLNMANFKSGAPFALDWEGRASATASTEQAEAIGEILSGIIGRKPIGYWGISGSTPSAPTEKMRAWPRWVPRYPKTGVQNWQQMGEPQRKNPGLYWPKNVGSTALPMFGQYTAWGRVPGISGDVDRSVAFFPSEEDALAWCRGDAATEPKPEPVHDVIEQILAADRFQDGVQAYQRSRGLTSDAYIGRLTLAAIGEDMRKRG